MCAYCVCMYACMHVYVCVCAYCNWPRDCCADGLYYIRTISLYPYNIVHYIRTISLYPYNIMHYTRTSSLWTYTIMYICMCVWHAFAIRALRVMQHIRRQHSKVEFFPPCVRKKDQALRQLAVSRATIISVCMHTGIYKGGSRPWGD